MKKTLAILLAAAFSVPVTYATITTTDSFGSIPGAPPNSYSGSGIPQNTSVVEVVNGLPGVPGTSGDLPVPDTLTLAESTTQHGSANPAPVNNGIDTFNVVLGTVGGRTRWNIDFYARSSTKPITAYSFEWIVTGNGQSVTINPLLIPDNVGAPDAFGNSESMDFAFLKIPLNFNPNQDGTYTSTLEAFYGGTEVGQVEETIIAGKGSPVPETSTYIAGAMLLLPFGFAVRKRIFGRRPVEAATA